MGGRGAFSSGGGMGGGTGAGGANGKGGIFYDKTSQFSGMSLKQFEDNIRGKSVEYVGLFESESGQLIIAGTSNSKGHVAIPAMPAGTDYSKITLTHNHPSGAERGNIGGTFSPADVENHARMGFAQTRAVTSGTGEHAYILRTTANSDSSKLLKNIPNVESNIRSKGNALVKIVEKNIGTKLEKSQQTAVYLNSLKRMWAKAATDAGYEYYVQKKG